MGQLSLQTIITYLVAAGLIVPVFKSLKLSPILGFMLVGMLVGPQGVLSLLPPFELLDWVIVPHEESEGIKALAELGVIFLLVMIGLDLSFERLWTMRRLVLGLGNVQILLTAAVISAIAFAWGNRFEAAVVIGGCLALSSTAMVLQLLVDQGRFGSPAGHASFSILLAQDLAVVPLLFLVTAFAGTSAASTGSDFGMAILRTVATIATIYLIGHAALRPLLRFVGKLNSPELFVASTLLVVILASSATHAAGLSAALGAFLAGLLLAESEYHHDIELYIEPFRGLLLGLFFMSIAMDIDLLEVGGTPALIVLSVAGLVGIKAFIATVSTRLFGFSWAHAVETGILLAQGGEFAFVVLGLALSLSLIPESTTLFMLIVVSASMFATPTLAWLSRKAAEFMESAPAVTPTPIDNELSSHVVLIGFGRTGQLLAEILNHALVPFIALDREASVVANDAQIQLGDGTRTETLRKLGLERARALVICINDQDMVQHIIEAATRVNPDLPILVRAHDDTHAERFVALGATTAIPEVRESGMRLAAMLLREMDFNERAASEVLARLETTLAPRKDAV